MEKPEEVVSIENVLKLLVKMLKPTFDDSNADSAEVSTIVTAFEDGKKYKIICTITNADLSKVDSKK
jgi:hypothetical protein